MSAGFGGTPFGDAFTAAAKRSKVDTAANVMMFRDPMGDTKRQLDQAVAFKPTTIVALDLLFWDVYGSSDPAWHDQALTTALDRLEQARAGGAWIVIADVPLITTASEMLLPKDAIPSQATLDAANERIRTFAARDHVILVPLGEWTAPLRAGAEITLPGGEKKPAAELMAIDGLHANPLGTWYLLDKLDHYIESQLPGTPKDALVFARPPN
ncbi:MAG: SGNH/GDSL hydrolase family protein [Kofleriaceae bacterium]|nr:SGNH/GDSL hydrolase family protein [Kofleriaceae bacterium]